MSRQCIKLFFGKDTVAKSDNLNPLHLRWLVNSRSNNQKSALRLFELFDKFENKMHKKELSETAESLAAACFSLWRAAFLADKTGVRTEAFADARAFLGKILTDNAISYPQDRSAREWTFNYYLNNAKNSLLSIQRYRKRIEKVLNVPKKVTKGSIVAERSWDRFQNAFEEAINCLEEELMNHK
jgi:hypothetical protein